MKSSRLSFGLFILTIGLAWLAKSLGWQPVGWSSILPYWPIVLIVWGVAIMVRQPVARGAALAVAAIFAAIWFVSWFDPVTPEGIEANQSLAVEANVQVITGDLRFDSGAGEFTIEANTASDDLLAVATVSPWGSYRLDQSITNSELVARVWYDQPWRRPMMGMMGGWRNEAIVSLDSNVIWNLEANVGAADFTLNADQLKLEQATISAGAASLAVRLGDRLTQSELTIKAGASDISVLVPQGVGVRAELSTGLTNHDLADLTEKSERIWETADYETATKKIELHFETGVSDIQLDRY
jgi:hypothetical protein